MSINYEGAIMISAAPRKITILFLAIALVAGLSGCTRKSDVTGKWNGKMTLEGSSKAITDLAYDLFQKDGELSGAMVFTKVEGSAMKLNGKRTGDELAFSTEHKRGLTLHFKGAVKSGSRIEGTAVLVYSDPKVPVKQDTVVLELTR